MEGCDSCPGSPSGPQRVSHLVLELSAPLSALESQIDPDGYRPTLCVWCGKEWGVGDAGTQDFPLRDSAHRPKTVMPLCK